jgi:hypothetical protein
LTSREAVGDALSIRYGVNLSRADAVSIAGRFDPASGEHKQNADGQKRNAYKARHAAKAMDFFFHASIPFISLCKMRAIAI